MFRCCGPRPPPPPVPAPIELTLGRKRLSNRRKAIRERVRQVLERAEERGMWSFDTYLKSISHTQFNQWDMRSQLGEGRWCIQGIQDRVFSSRGTPDSPSTPMVCLLPGIIHDGLGPDTDTVLKEVDASLRALCEVQPPGLPHSNSRFAHLPLALHRAHYNALGLPYGVIHYADWLELGHGYKGLQSSSDLNTDRNHKTRAKMRFFTAIRPLWPVISAAFAALDRKCLTRYMTAARKIEPTSYLHLNLKSDKFPFSGLAINLNIAAGPHKDSHDVPEGWVCMFAFGTFTGGDVVIPALKLRIPLQPGTLLFVRARLLEHYIAPFEGHRVGVVGFFHEGVLQRVEESYSSKEESKLAKKMGRDRGET